MNNHTLAEGFDSNRSIHTFEEHFAQTTDEAIQAAAIGKGQAVAVNDPQNRNNAENSENLCQNGQHVFSANQATVEQCQARNNH